MVREVARAARVYIIAHVSDDVGEATVRGACEAGGLVGSAPGQARIRREDFVSIGGVESKAMLLGAYQGRRPQQLLIRWAV